MKIVRFWVEISLMVSTNSMAIQYRFGYGLDRLDWIGWIWLDDSHFQCLYRRLLCHGCDGRRSRLILGKELGDSKSQTYRVFYPLAGGHPQPLKGALRVTKNHLEAQSSWGLNSLLWTIVESLTIFTLRSSHWAGRVLQRSWRWSLPRSQQEISDIVRKQHLQTVFYIVCINKYQNISEC